MYSGRFVGARFLLFKIGGMSMKKLQSNFTTVEQSKRLLKLGVPADSADCYWFDERDLMFLKDELYSEEAKDGEWVRATDYAPCWSVGRLIEIMKICAKPKEQAIMVNEMLYCKDLVELLVYMIAANKQVIDFSKLEE